MRALLIAGAGLVATLARADDGDPVVAQATPAERAVLDELAKEQYVKARDDAEAILARDPTSFVATWAMARVQHDEEGNHARALYYVHRAEQLLHDRFGDPASWDAQALREEFSLDDEMDRSVDAIAVLDRYKARYGAGAEWLKIWPLFKLHRIDEARALGLRLASSDDERVRTSVYNSMLALEFEEHDREATYRWARDAMDVSQGKSCTVTRNAAGCAYLVFKLSEAKELGLSAHSAEDQDCTGAGYDQLAGLYLIEGDFQKSLAALQSLKAQAIPKRYRPHYAIARRAILADILYALGKVDDAERLAAEVYGLPERLGRTSRPKRINDFVRAFRYWRALDVAVARDRERASYRPLFAGVTMASVDREYTLWTLAGAVTQLVADDQFLIDIVRPNLGELSEDAAWARMSLAQIVGTGVVRDALTAGRKVDAKYAQAGGYFDAYDGELAFRDGAWSRALGLAQSALAGLPREEALQRWRVQAWQAEALRRLGKLDQARPLYHEVLQKFPSVLRLLGLALPVSITSDGSSLADAAARRVARSPRFDVVANAPFQIAATSEHDTVELCLRDATGFTYGCASGDKHARDDETVIAALDAFHDATFSPKVALTQADLNSLDGSPVRQSADTVLKGILAP